MYVGFTRVCDVGGESCAAMFILLRSVVLYGVRWELEWSQVPEAVERAHALNCIFNSAS